MAPVSLMAAQNPALQSVLEQLAANTPPPEPSWWPFALGYWLCLLLLLLIFSASGLYWWRNREWRQLNRQLKTLQQLEDVREQSKQAHALLRWVRIHKLGDSPRLSEQQLSQRVQHSLGDDERPWLNSHYRRDVQAPDWHDLQQLLRCWRKEAKR